MPKWLAGPVRFPISKSNTDPQLDQVDRRADKQTDTIVTNNRHSETKAVRQDMQTGYSSGKD